MEIPTEKIFLAQKLMIQKCNTAGKPVVTATQMLESMCNNPRPTRAEATDVANAVLDGTDCVMLSGETAAGKFPREAVEIMGSICQEAELCVDNYQMGLRLTDAGLAVNPKMSVLESLASSAVNTSYKMNAPVIVVLAATGVTARLIAKYRPSVPVIVGVVPRGESRDKIGFKGRDVDAEQVARQCLLTKGLIPVVVQPKNLQEESSAAAKACVMEAIAEAKRLGFCAAGDDIVTLYNVESQCAVIRVVECP